MKTKYRNIPSVQDRIGSCQHFPSWALSLKRCLSCTCKLSLMELGQANINRQLLYYAVLVKI